MPPQDERRRTLKVKCPTWDHVETFFQRKVRPNGTLAMRVPFATEPGVELALALELPSALVVSIDGRIATAEHAVDGKKTAVVLELYGLTETLRGRLEALVADGRAEGGATLEAAADPPPAQPPAPRPADVPMDELVEPPAPIEIGRVCADERSVFARLEQEGKRLGESAAHETLGVSWGATVNEIRLAYFDLTKKYHPDAFARYESQAIRELAQEVFIHINRAYDRMRDAAVGSGDAIIAGPALLPHSGWLANFEDLGEQSTTPLPAPVPRPPTTPAPAHDSLLPAPPSRSLPDPLDSTLLASPLAPIASQANKAGELNAAPEKDGPAAASAEKKSRQSHAELTRAELFDDGPDPDALASDATTPLSGAGAGREKARDNSQPSDDEVMSLGRELLEAGSLDEARAVLSDGLGKSPRNRSMRALYHVAVGRKLVQDDHAVRAIAQFEAALAHDRTCVEARVSLDRLRKDPPKKGLFKRLFR